MDHGVDLHTKTNDGETLLHGACDGGHLEAVQLLINLDANVHAKDDRGRTALHATCWSGCNENIVGRLHCMRHVG
jgi:ankyrin repeat protein